MIMFSESKTKSVKEFQRMRIFKSITILCMLFSLCAEAQDSHISQIYEMPILLNPARTGFFKDNYRLAGDYRSQWKEITVPYKTLSGTIDLNVPAGKNKNNVFGIALLDYADKAGDADYTTNYIEACMAFHKNFGKNFSHYIGAGIIGGFGSTSFDISKMTFDEDFGPGTNTEVPDFTSANFFDMSVGAEYNYLDENVQFNFGAAVYHANKPTIAYYNNTDAFIYRKYVLSSGFAKVLSPLLEIQPRVAFYMQGATYDLLLGSDLKVVLSKNTGSNYALYIGGYYRVGDAIIPKFRIDMGDLSFGVSYDFNVATLGAINQLAGGPELSVSFLGSIKGVSAGRIYSPRF
jgi:type IX secretion system PorP/SprF family membrane protein